MYFYFGIQSLLVSYISIVRGPVGSLSIYEKYTDDDYQAFRLLSANIEEGAAFGSEPFPGSFLGPLNKNISLSQDISLLLADFYCNTYNKNFVILSHLHNAPDGSIPVLPKVNKYSRLKIRTEVFGLKMCPQYPNCGLIAICDIAEHCGF
ncbi:unnamed protein product [Rhizophagus irregularis]|nr:unnamed protein product [Rhizophagus irregularis]